MGCVVPLMPNQNILHMNDETPFGPLDAKAVAPDRWKWYYNAIGQPLANGVGNWILFEVHATKGQWALLREASAQLNNPQPQPLHQAMGKCWAHLPSMGGCWTKEG